MTQEYLLSAADVSARLGVTTQTLAIWRCTRRNLPYVKIGALVRYRAGDVETFIAANTRARADVEGRA